MNSFLPPATLPKMNNFFGTFQGFCLKFSEDVFHRSPPCISAVILDR